MFAVGCAALPFFYIRAKRDRRMHQIEEILPDAIDLFTRAMRAGHNIHSGLQVLADETPEPLGGEFKKLVEDLALGSTVAESLHTLGDRVPLLDLRFFSTGVILQRETGANIVMVMENLSAVIRERLQLRARLRAHTAQQRFSAGLLCGLPIVTGVAFYFLAVRIHFSAVAERTRLQISDLRRHFRGPGHPGHPQSGVGETVMSYPLIFLLSTLACSTLFVVALNYYFGTRQDALNRRIQELQEESMSGVSGPLLGGDFLDMVLRSTYGAIFGKGWFRQKELELMRAGFRGPTVVKTYGILSLSFTVALVAIALVVLQRRRPRDVADGSRRGSCVWLLHPGTGSCLPEKPASSESDGGSARHHRHAQHRARRRIVVGPGDRSRRRGNTFRLSGTGRRVVLDDA